MLMKGKKYKVGIEIVKVKMMGKRQLRVPSRIRLFGLEYQLSQPINLNNYTLQKKGEEKKNEQRAE